MRMSLPCAITRAIALAGVVTGSRLAAQEGYPVPPRPRPDAEEIALATSAAPPAISGAAAVYVVRASGPVKVREGTNGVACMVSRDLHQGSVYPICFDREAARTTMQRELMENTLRAGGLSEEQVQQRVEAAYAKGSLDHPAKPAVTYMLVPARCSSATPRPVAPGSARGILTSCSRCPT